MLRHDRLGGSVDELKGALFEMQAAVKTAERDVHEMEAAQGVSTFVPGSTTPQR